MVSSSSPHQWWSSVPPHHRFWGPSDALAKALAHAPHLREFNLDLRSLRIDSDASGNLGVSLPSGRALALTPFAFDRLCETADAPADFLRTLPSNVVGDILRDRLPSRIPQDGVKQVYTRAKGDDLIIRDFAGVNYERTNMVAALTLVEKLLDQGWRVPPGRPVKPGDDARERPATADDVLNFARHRNGMSIKEGDIIAPAGFYMTDHESFCVLVRENSIKLPNGAWGHEIAIIKFSDLATGEAASFLHGLFNGVCGNHLIDGFSQLGRASIAHRRGSMARFEAVLSEAHKPYDTSPMLEAGARAATLRIADKTEEVTDKLFGALRAKTWAAPLTKKTIEAGVKTALMREDRYGDPRTLWAIHSGITENSQELSDAGRKMSIDIAASKMLTIDI